MRQMGGPTGEPGGLPRPSGWGRLIARAGRVVLLCGVLVLLLTASGSALLRSADARQARVAYPRVLVVGDSISAGWFASSPAASYPQRLFASLRASNPASADWSQVIGLPGKHAEDGVRVLRALPNVPRADLIVVEFGTNDYGNRPVSPGSFARSYATLLNLLTSASPQATVVCVSVWGPSGHPNSFGATPETYNAILDSACRALPHSAGVVVDITSLYARPGARGPRGHASYIATHTDGFHPNDAGHTAIAQAIVAALPASAAR